jgi:hypothetical protein
MTDQRRWAFAWYVLLVVVFGIGLLVPTLTGMPGRLVGALETVVFFVLVLLYAAYRAYIQPRFAPNKNTGDIPPESPTP